MSCRKDFRGVERPSVGQAVEKRRGAAMAISMAVLGRNAGEKLWIRPLSAL